MKKNRYQLKKILDSKLTKNNLSKIAFITLVVASVPIIVVGGFALGNAVQVFKMFNKNKKYKDIQIRNAIRGLKRNKYIEYVSDSNGVTTIRITRKGENKLKSFEIDALEIKRPKTWDGKWRVVMFDLPIQYKKVRNSLRFRIKQIGFKQFQKSVWVYPYPCIDEILFITNYYKVGRYVEILTVEEIENDRKLKVLFNLT